MLAPKQVLSRHLNRGVSKGLSSWHAKIVSANQDKYFHSPYYLEQNQRHLPVLLSDKIVSVPSAFLEPEDADNEMRTRNDRRGSQKAPMPELILLGQVKAQLACKDPAPHTGLPAQDNLNYGRP